MYKKPHFFSFSGRTTVGEFWSSFFASLMGSFATGILLCIVLVLMVPGEVEELAQLAEWVFMANCLFWFVHIVAMSHRRLRDAGFTAKSYLWLLLPGVGTFIFIFRRLCAYSVD
jgi:uncharacterized membrane protein YhaH (DUF805 family)